MWYNDTSKKEGEDFMHNKVNGDYLIMEVDRATNEAVMREAGGALRDVIAPGRYPISPCSRSVRHIAERYGNRDGPVRIRVDALVEGDTMIYTLHCTEDFRSVVNVERSLIKKIFNSQLTPRELEIAIELFEGCTIRCIAASLHIAEGTVKRIIHNIYQKMNVVSQMELIREIYVRIAQHAALKELQAKD